MVILQLLIYMWIFFLKIIEEYNIKCTNMFEEIKMFDFNNFKTSFSDVQICISRT